MSNQGKVWDIREAYKLRRNNSWHEKGDVGIVAGGRTPSADEINTIEKRQISTNGTFADFGDLTQAKANLGGDAGGDFVKAFFAGGTTPSNSNVIETLHYSSDGNGVDFGDLPYSDYAAVSHSDNTRLVIPQGEGRSNAINYLTMNSKGNTSDFGDCTNSVTQKGTMGDTTRLIASGGTDSPNSQVNVMQFVTMQSLGNAADFGDLNYSCRINAGNSNGVRGLFAGGMAFFGGGNPNNTSFNNIDFVTIASTGNATDFGNLTYSLYGMAGTTNGKTGLFAGGATYPGGTYYSHVDGVTISTAGNAVDFGDLTTAKQGGAGAGNGHGGLNPGEQLPSVTYMPGSGRGLIVGGEDGPGNNLTNVEVLTITTLGNSFDFGDMDVGSRDHAVVSSLTRVLKGGSSSPSLSDAIGSIEMQSLGNGSDFGDLTEARRNPGGFSNTTRGLFAGGSGTPGSNTMKNIIDYVTIASAGNATDFGDLTSARRCSNSGAGSSTRALFSGGTTPGTSDYVNTIDYVTTGSTGNATDFGDLTVARSYGSALSSSTRAVYCAGQSPSVSNVIDYVTTASTGNATDFGDSTLARANMARLSNSTRGVFASGYASPGMQNVIDFITIGSTGNATDFGDVTTARSTDGQSDSHGGLQSA